MVGQTRRAATATDGKRMDEKRIDRWMAMGLGTLAFAVYLCTNGDGPADVPVSAHPLLRACMRAMAIWSGAGVDDRLWTAIVALFGGLAVALVYRVMKESLSALMCPEPELGSSLNEGVTDAVRSAKNAIGRESCSTAGAAVGTLFFAFGTPFWTSATAVSEGPFEVLFMMILVCLLLQCHASGGREICSIVMFLSGLGVADSPVFLGIVPVVLVVVGRALIFSDTCSERDLPLYLLSGLTGVSAGLGAFVLLAGTGDPTAAVQLFVRQYCAAFSLSACHGGWILVWGLPAAVLCLSASCLRSIAARDESAGVAGSALLLMLTAAVIANALAFPHTVWPVAQKWHYVPVLPNLLLAFSAGGLFGCWLRMGLAREDFSQDEYPLGASILRIVGLAACGAMVIVALRQPCLAMEELKRSERKCEGGSPQSLLTKDGITVNRQNERKGGDGPRDKEGAARLEITLKPHNQSDI